MLLNLDMSDTRLCVVWRAALRRLQGGDQLVEVKDALAETKSFVFHKELQRLCADEDVLKLQASAEVQSAVWVGRAVQAAGGRSSC